MARFMGKLTGQGKAITRTGHESTGLSAEAFGWNVGGMLVAQVEDGEDVIYVFRTGGSNDAFGRTRIAKITKEGVTFYERD